MVTNLKEAQAQFTATTAELNCLRCTLNNESLSVAHLRDKYIFLSTALKAYKAAQERVNNVLEDNGAMGYIIMEYSVLHQQICKLMKSILEHSEQL